jgi:hypothetical protein
MDVFNLKQKKMRLEQDALFIKFTKSCIYYFSTLYNIIKK